MREWKEQQEARLHGDHGDGEEVEEDEEEPPLYQEEKVKTEMGTGIFSEIL